MPARATSCPARRSSPCAATATTNTRSPTAVSFISGNEPERLGIVSEPIVTLDGLVTGFPAGVATNRPLAGATVEVYRVSPDSGARLGAPVHRRVTGPDGAWGPVTVEPGWFLEFVVEAPAHPTTHLYRSPFPRSSSVVHLRPGRPLGDKDSGA